MTQPVYMAGKMDISKKTNREIYKVILRSRIQEERMLLTQLSYNFKERLSPSGLWSSFWSGTNSLGVYPFGGLVKALKGYPYISFAVAKGLFHIITKRRKKTIVKLIAAGMFLKLMHNKSRHKSSNNLPV